MNNSDSNHADVRNPFGWMLLLFILTWTTISFHSCMIKRRLDRIEQRIIDNEGEPSKQS